MGLFDQDQMDQIDAIAAKSKEVLKPIQVSKSVTSSQHEIEESTRMVLEYFKDSPAILITSVEELHEYVTKAIATGYCGIDTETTGLDRIHDTIVGCSLYYPGGVECYIPNKHRVPIFETPYKNQLTYEEVGKELQRFVDAKTKMIFANADFDLAMIYKDYKVDLIPVCYYDVILAWRCLKEDEPQNGLKQLYSKYVMRGKIDPKKFSDFFSPKLFPYCKPEVAKLYAANDAKITFDLFKWQLPFVTKSNPKCQKNHLEKIADLVWNIEFPMIRVCAMMHRVGVYYDIGVRNTLKVRYDSKYQKENTKLADMVQGIIDEADINTVNKSPFKSGKDFNEGSPKHVVYLINDFLGCQVSSGDKDTLKNLGLPVTDQILKVRALGKLLNSFIDKLPEEVGADGRIHSTFKSVGASTGRFSSSDPNVQQIPSHALDIRHQFRATPAMEMVSDCTISGHAVSITLGSYDSVELLDGTSKDVIDLEVGNSVKAYNSDVVLTISEKVDYLPKTKIVFITSSTINMLNAITLKHITPPYIMMSSDYSQQEPKMTAFVSQDPNMVKAFKEGKDIYATIASLSFNKPYEECMEFNPITGANQPEGKERRGYAKVLVLGICYGMSTMTIGESLFGKNKEMTSDEKTQRAQEIYDAVLRAFPNLRAIMLKSQEDARKQGYVETILGRRRHIPDMQLKPYEFKAGKGYINPDIDPLDPKTLKNKNELPERIVRKLEQEFANYKYKGQIYKRIKQLEEDEHIKVINNTKKITDASRQCLNSIIQGSAAELTKIAMLKVFSDSEWNKIGARILLPVHDELIAEVPLRNATRASEILGKLMSAAGDFLPFTISCDVATTIRWYGLAYPCKYDKPTSITDIKSLTLSEISWVQYHLFEMEYTLPIHKKEGIKLEGDAALGVDGEWSEDMDRFIFDYISRNHITEEEFIDHIENKVVYDLQKLK